MTSATAKVPKPAVESANPIAWVTALIAAIIAAVLILKIPPLAHPWPQSYDPTGHWWLSALLAALPVVVLLGTLALLHMKAHYSALLGLATSLLCAIWIFGMPVSLAAKTAVLGAGYGLLPIGWIILNVIFLYQLTCEAGLFKVLQESLTGITQDRRLQLLLIAFSFGAFFEGAAGFGTPVAVTAAVLIGLGFGPLEASGLSLIANTAPVAYGALGTPLIALQGVTGLDLRELSAQAGRILPFFSVLVPFWLVWAFAGFQGMLEVWPAVLVAGVFFAIPQYLMSNFHGPWLVDVVAAIVSMLALIVFLLKWQPKRIWGFENEGKREARGTHGHSRALVTRAWVPWLVLSVVVFVWGLPSVKTKLDKLSAPKFPVVGLHQMVQRVPPVVRKPTAEAAVYSLNWLSATGSGILVAAIISGFVMGFTPWKMAHTLLANDRASAILLAHHRRHALHRLHDTLFRAGRHHGVGVCANRRALSIFWNVAGLAGRGADRVRHRVECVVRQPATNFRRAGRGLTHIDGGSEQLWWRDGKNDRCAKHRRSQHRHGVVWTRGRHLAFRVLPQHCVGGFGGNYGDPPSLCISVHPFGGAVGAPDLALG